MCHPKYAKIFKNFSFHNRYTVILEKNLLVIILVIDELQIVPPLEECQTVPFSSATTESHYQLL